MRARAACWRSSSARVSARSDTHDCPSSRYTSMSTAIGPMRGSVNMWGMTRLRISSAISSGRSGSGKMMPSWSGGCCTGVVSYEGAVGEEHVQVLGTGFAEEHVDEADVVAQVGEGGRAGLYAVGELAVAAVAPVDHRRAAFVRTGWTVWTWSQRTLLPCWLWVSTPTTCSSSSRSRMVTSEARVGQRTMRVRSVQFIGPLGCGGVGGWCGRGRDRNPSRGGSGFVGGPAVLAFRWG